MIEQRLITLRKKIRLNVKRIIDTLLSNHFANICVICSSTENLTKEHVIPKWVFENNPKAYFSTEINGINQEYSKTTIPTCSECNSYIFSALERYLEIKFRQIELDDVYFDEADIEKIILWLEFIDYKFQVLNFRRKLKKPKNSKFIPFLAYIPISVMQNMDASPHKIFSNLGNALKKLSIKSKAEKVNSLVIYITTNKSYHFFHKTNEFIFIELPKHQIAFFYFINQNFNSKKEASIAAKKLIKKVY